MVGNEADRLFSRFLSPARDRFHEIGVGVLKIIGTVCCLQAGEIRAEGGLLRGVPLLEKFGNRSVLIYLSTAARPGKFHR